MNNNRKRQMILLLLPLSLAMPGQSEARSLTFPSTPVKQVSLEGNWGERVEGGADPGKGARYSGSVGELGVIVLEAAVPPASAGILSSADKPLSVAQRAELMKAGNPAILRRCVEAGSPRVMQSQHRRLLVSEFIADEHMRVSTADGKSMGIPAFRYEAHAFTLDGGRLVHIYLIRSVIRNAQAKTHEEFLKEVATDFQSILSRVQWRPECISRLSRASSFDSATVGEQVHESASHAAYAEASATIAGLETDDLDWLLENGTPAGRLYGAVLLWQSSRVGPDLSYGKLLPDVAEVKFRVGCEVETTTVRNIARSLLERNGYADFKVGMSCKLKSPVDNR